MEFMNVDYVVTAYGPILSHFNRHVSLLKYGYWMDMDTNNGHSLIGYGYLKYVNWVCVWVYFCHISLFCWDKMKGEKRK